MTTPKSSTPDGDDRYPICQRCGDTYDLHEGCEPSTYCDRCAQVMVDKLSEELLAMKRLALRYGQHDGNCAIHMLGYQRGDMDCTCGWDELFAKLKAELEDKP